MNHISPGLFERNGVFYARPSINGRRTWRKLKAVKKKAALKELANAEWSPVTDNFNATADLYVKAGCPTNHTKFLAAPLAFQAEESARCTRLKRYFGPRKLHTIELATLMDFHKWRTRGLPTGTGGRAVDKETQTLSNVLNYAVFVTKQLKTNPIRSNRPRFHTTKTHSRERMPESGDIIHQIANHFFSSVRTEVHGWHCYLAMFTGCRTSELLRLRHDAAKINTARFEAGYLQRDFSPGDLSPLYAETVALLHLQRSKHGINPWSLVGPEFLQMLESLIRWKNLRFPDNAHFIPSPQGGVMGEKQFGRALTQACTDLGLPQVTPHGFRAFYVTKRRRDLIPDPFVAAEIGDKTVSLVATTYGETPGRGKLSWLPSTGLPAWLRWRPESEKIQPVAGIGRPA